MAKFPKKINAVVDMLIAGKDHKEIMEATDCSASTITVAKKRLAERQKDIDAATEETNNGVDAHVDSFIKSIKIAPDPDVLTKDTPEVEEDTDYECPGCGHEWNADVKTHQDTCPACGMEFE